jgi:uncharacterized protein (TIGR03083 family)
MLSPAERVQVFKAENRRILAFLRELTSEQWEHPSPCEEWTIADVVAHLTSFSSEYAGNILRTVQGDASGPAPVVRTTNDLMDAAPLARHAIDYRKGLGASIFERYVEAVNAVEASFDQVGPDDWQKLCYRKYGAETLTNVLDVFIVDVGVHRWDLMSPFDPDVHLSPEGLAVMAGRYPHRPRWWDLPLPPDHPSPPARFRFEITDVAVPAADFVIAADGEKFMEVTDAPPATVTFRSDAETFILVAYGRIKPPAAAQANGRLTYSGDEDWAGVFLRSFVGG